MVIVRAWTRLKNMYMSSLPMAFESRFLRDSTNVIFVKLHHPSKLVMVSKIVVHSSFFIDKSFCFGNLSFGALLQRRVKEFPCVKDWFGAKDGKQKRGFKLQRDYHIFAYLLWDSLN